MLTLSQFELGETAVSLLQQADGQTIMITEGDAEVGAIVSKEYLDQIKRLALDQIHEISARASEKVEEHAAELGIPVEELIQRLIDDDEG
jgi:hypothetical protein